MKPIYLKIAAEKWYVCDITLFIFNWKLKKKECYLEEKDIKRKLFSKITQPTFDSQLKGHLFA